LIFGDNITVEIELKNNSSSILENIVYIEKIPEYMEVNTSNIVISNNLEIKSSPLYDFLIDGFSLARNASITIKYS
jgi:hypothetical protein